MRFLSVFDQNSPTPAIDPTRDRLDSATCTRLSAYLRAGVRLMGTTQKVPDVLTESSTPIVPISIHTDGEYVWSMAVAYYVETHRISTGEEFLVHCASNGWTVPSLSFAEVEEGLAFVNASRPTP
ncbi:hypothetical protein FE634_02280 [Nocardioides dongxiaopingii]|uniref:hypothetical protein n=1 Tax=Nocardioides sp. S-1144 TaxID=2582905 RepID=UPI00110E4119|nr:hypothetical protein [Nocardioides sp. S-1144]QCW49532.1 hypothetical protein FE634_02280 [Nocardioides sp. S-1144]